MPHDPQRLSKALTSILDFAVGTLSSPPERKVVTPGAPSHDCAQLAVWASPIRTVALAQGADLPAPKSQPRQRVVTVHVLLLGSFCYGPSLKADVVDAAGKQLAVDGWSLFCGLLDGVHGDTILPTAEFGTSAWLRNVVASEIQRQEGDRAGWHLTMEVGL